MPKMPRDISGAELIKGLEKLGYKVIRRSSGSHVRLQKESHVITVPDHQMLKIGTLNAILIEIAAAINKTKFEVIDMIF